MIWTRIGEIVASVGLTLGEGARTVGSVANDRLADLIEAVRTVFEGDPETRRRVAFSIAMIALSAKMAKADGVVTVDEVAAFERIFEIPEDERANVARLYDLAKGDTAGFEGYAAQLAGLCDAGTRDCPLLSDILEGLFHIATADGVLHEAELAFLERTAEIFGLSETRFEAMLSRHVAGGEGDPYALLGIAPDATMAEVRAHYRKLVAEHHPDKAIARGLPEEFVAIATERMATFNDAMQRIEAARSEAARSEA